MARRLKTWVLILLAFGIGSIFFSGSYAVQALEYTSAIPPTNAFDDIGVSTPWSTFANFTNVTADSSGQMIYFVSDGSIAFNVTTTYP